jgi:hypothetical protein
MAAKILPWPASAQLRPKSGNGYGIVNFGKLFEMAFAFLSHRHAMKKISVVRHQQLLDRPTRRVLPFLAGLLLATPLAGPITPALARSNPPAAGRTEPRPRATSGHIARFDTQMRARYAALGVQQQGLQYAVFEQAMTGYLNLQRQGRVGPQQRLAVIDFDLPSTEKRLWVLDLAKNQVLYRTLVAHGDNSGEQHATRFSNTADSHMSSLGFYVTGSEYRGKHGRSLRLAGVDEGFNTNAAARSIVVHGAEYVSEAFIQQTGRLGRSQGCPALPLDQYGPIIDTLKGGAGLFIHKSNAGYSSRFLNEQAVSFGPSPAS